MKQLNHKTVPTQKRPIKVFQFGEGNFLRAFVDWIFDIANEKGVTDTGIALVSPRYKRSSTLEALKSQDGLYHVILEGVENCKPKREIRLVKSVQDAFTPLDDYERYESYACSPELRFVVSNTTEAGIRYEKDNILDPVPTSFPGKVTNFLYKRFKHFGADISKGLIFLCCELIEDNGTRLHEYIVRHAQEAGLGDDFINWIDKSCIFCDTLVDRIVPGFPRDNVDEIKVEIGYDDNAIDNGEFYHLWAIGGKDYKKVAEELPLDKAGLHVLFLPSIKAFRDKKVRILNGSHTGMVAISLLMGLETVLQAFQNDHVNRFVNSMVQKEVLPVIDDDPKELQRFSTEILERFYNPYVKHMLGSIALNSLSKWEARNYPTVRDNYVKKGELADYEIFTFAALMALYAPASKFEPNDTPEHVACIREHWDDDDYEGTLRRILSNKVFLIDFETEVPGFVKKAAQYIADIRQEGMEKALEKFLNAHE